MNNLITINYLVPFLCILIIPIILFKTLIDVNKISENIYPNYFSLFLFLFLIFYGYSSIILSKKKFKGNKNIDNSEPEYADNGFKFWYITTILTIILSILIKNLPNLIVNNFIPFTLTCNIFGLLFALYLYYNYKNNYHDIKQDKEKGYNEIFKFYRGLKFHPKILGVDIKQLTNCRFGMITWQILIIIFYIYNLKKSGFNSGLTTTVLLQSIYIGKFFYWETGYFNTLDITLDRAGYYICWGCLVFVPSFYTFTTYYLINNPPIISKLTSLIILILGLYFLYKNYEVDWQKEQFKKNSLLLNNLKPKYLSVKYEKDNKIIDSKLLIDGHWGYARHTNYTYELLLAACWSLVGYNFGLKPFYYLIYLTILLIHRIYRDENKCKKKYNKYWDDYSKIVPYKLIKHLY